jgi:hypothetical protein
MADEIGSLAGWAGLPRKLTRQSTTDGLHALDILLNSVGDDGARFFTDSEFLRNARQAAEDWLRAGYRFAKLSVLLPAGGLGLSYGLVFPDRDIRLLGIGSHRYFLFHSALGLVALRHFYRDWMEKQADPQRWSSRVKRKVAGAALGSFAAGVGVHLAVDVFQPKAVLFPFIGSLADGTMVDDNVWLIGNSLWAFRISREVFALSLADELEAAWTWVREHFETSEADWSRLPEVLES